MQIKLLPLLKHFPNAELELSYMNGSDTERLVGLSPFRDVIVPGQVNCAEANSAVQKNMLIATATRVGNMVDPQSLSRTTSFIRGSPCLIQARDRIFTRIRSYGEFQRWLERWTVGFVSLRMPVCGWYSRICRCLCGTFITRECTEDFTDSFCRVRKIFPALRGYEAYST